MRPFPSPAPNFVFSSEAVWPWLDPKGRKGSTLFLGESYNGGCIAEALASRKDLAYRLAGPRGPVKELSGLLVNHRERGMACPDLKPGCLFPGQGGYAWVWEVVGRI